MSPNMVFTPQAPPRDKRRTRTRSRSQDPDDMDEDMQPIESTSSTSSPREFSPGPSAGAALSQQPLPSPHDELQQAANVILELTRKFAKIVRALAMFEPQAALDSIMQLPPEQTKAPWVYALMGRARFEMADYLIVSHRRRGTSVVVLIHFVIVGNENPLGRRLPERSNKLEPSILIGCGIWMSSPQFCGICNGMYSCRSWPKSLLRSTSIRLKLG